MHPYLIEQAAAAQGADLRREALANCCANLIARPSLRDLLTTAIARLAAAFARPGQPRCGTPVCCPA